MTGCKSFFDTALFIYAFEKKDESVRSLFSEAYAGGMICTSVITVMEYCTGCYHAEDRIQAQLFWEFLKDYFYSVQDINEAIALDAAEIRAQYPAFKAMDSLQLACARHMGADVFYTSDRQLLQYQDDRLQVRGVFLSQ